MNKEELSSGLAPFGIKITDLPILKTVNTLNINEALKEELALEFRLTKFLESGTLGARDAFNIYMDVLKPAGLRVVVHGSPVSKEKLKGNVVKPTQATWSDEDGLSYKDGEPAIATTPSGNITMALIRSQLHDQAEPLKGKEDCLVLSVMKDDSDKTFLFTSEEVVRSLEEENFEGALHVLRMPIKEAEFYVVNRNGEGMREIRLTKETGPVLSIPTYLADLPDDILVVDAPRSVIMPHLYSLQESNIQTLRKRLLAAGINIRPLRGEWPLLPLRDHPKFRKREG